MPTALTLVEYLQTHPYGRLDPIGFPDPSLAYQLDQGENVLADVTVTDNTNNPIPADDILNVLISLRREEAVVASWSWAAEGEQSPQISIPETGGHVLLEISKEDTVQLAGLYDFEVQLTVANTDFFFSLGQTDVIEANSTLFVRVVPIV